MILPVLYDNTYVLHVTDLAWFVLVAGMTSNLETEFRPVLQHCLDRDLCIKKTFLMSGLPLEETHHHVQVGRWYEDGCWRYGDVACGAKPGRLRHIPPSR